MKWTRGNSFVDVECNDIVKLLGSKDKWKIKDYDRIDIDGHRTVTMIHCSSRVVLHVTTKELSVPGCKK